MNPNVIALIAVNFSLYKITPISNCKVGLTYINIPAKEYGVLFMPCAKSNNGTAVIIPANGNNKNCIGSWITPIAPIPFISA